jgi:transcription-repair coupling factor (superfamily II helicase)
VGYVVVPTTILRTQHVIMFPRRFERYDVAEFEQTRSEALLLIGEAKPAT